MLFKLSCLSQLCRETCKLKVLGVAIANSLVTDFRFFFSYLQIFCEQAVICLLISLM